jgi:methylated-DNA-protein-cysteine methyltransferase related protein
MSEFSKKVIDIVCMVPQGKVVSYGQVALMAGVPRAARQVGRILHLFGDGPGVPWWRVINNTGRISTKCPEHTPLIQKSLLESEGIIVSADFEIDMGIYRFAPSEEDLEGISLSPEYIYLLRSKYSL